jgi:hypothetical protein
MLLARFAYSLFYYYTRSTSHFYSSRSALNDSRYGLAIGPRFRSRQSVGGGRMDSCILSYSMVAKPSAGEREAAARSSRMGSMSMEL